MTHPSAFSVQAMWPTEGVPLSQASSWGLCYFSGTASCISATSSWIQKKINWRQVHPRVSRLLVLLIPTHKGKTRLRILGQKQNYAHPPSKQWINLKMCHQLQSMLVRGALCWLLLLLRATASALKQRPPRQLSHTFPVSRVAVEFISTGGVN